MRDKLNEGVVGDTAKLMMHRHDPSLMQKVKMPTLMMRKTAPLEKAVRIRLHSFQRRKDARAKPLSQHQSGRTWKFAEILVRATDVFGCREKPSSGSSDRLSDLTSTARSICSPLQQVSILLSNISNVSHSVSIRNAFASIIERQPDHGAEVGTWQRYAIKRP
ncbi:hypothetical protein V1291_003552 [Nitrobacteraceae bacterium AZCC 1564]